MPAIVQSQPLIGPASSNLLQKGMIEQNIIDIHHLIETINNTDIENKNGNTRNKISRSEHWKVFTDDLKNYGDNKVAIKEQQTIYEKIQKEANHLNKQKQEIIVYVQSAISFISILNNEISYYKGRLYNLYLNNKINLPSGFSRPFIFVVYKTKKYKGNTKNNNNKLNENGNGNENKRY